ncbi:MAG: TonB-dependent receptor [Sideroxydans sp.]|nr:TonB-dependent receptor [Sideroxydans sp.]
MKKKNFTSQPKRAALSLRAACLIAMAMSTQQAQAADEQPALKEVTVTATGVDVAERREATTQKVVLDRKEIEKMSAMTVGDVLTKLPGVEVGSGGMGQQARGMSRDSVQVLVDGERSASGGTFVGVIGRLPSGDLERVEILRGASAEYGGAASVTVNLVMKKAVRNSSAGEVRVGLGVRGSEVNTQLTVSKSGGDGNFSWQLPLSLLWSASPISRDIDRQDFTGATRGLWQQEADRGRNRLGHHSFSPRFSWKDGADSFYIAPMYFWGPVDTQTTTSMTKYSVPATGTGLLFNGDRTSQTNGYTKLLRVRMEGEKHLDDVKLVGRVSLNSGRKNSDTSRVAHDASNVLTTSNDNTVGNENEVNMAWRMDKPMGVEHLLAVGLEHVNLKRTDEQTYSGVANTYQASERQYTAWVQDDWMLREKMTLTYGLRGENVALDSNGVAQQRGQLMPSVAFKWEPVEKWLVRTSLGAGLKMPKLEEISNAGSLSLSTNTPVEADRRGNPNLLPERSINYEAVLERYLDKEAGVFGANLYIRSTQDFTERRVQLEGARWIDRPQNEGRATHWGVELDGKMRMDDYGWKGATLKSHLTLPNAKVQDTRLGISRTARETPKYSLSAGLDAGVPSLKSSYGVSMQMSGESKTDIPGEQHGVTQARTTVDAFWLYQMTPMFKVRLSGQNLFAADIVRDMAYTSVGKTWQLHSVDNGYRSVMATVEGRW